MAENKIKLSVDDSLSITGAILDIFLGSKQLPPVASIGITAGKSVFQIATQLRERSFNEKLTNFLEQTGTTSDEDRIHFLQRLDKNKEEFWAQILQSLERLDENKKSILIGKLCSALILEHIKLDIFFRLTYVIERSFLQDLHFLNERFLNTATDVRRQNVLVEFDNTLQNAPIINNLVNAGLLKQDRTGILQHGSTGSVIGHSITELGDALLKYGF